jgi:type VI secretion system protein ImpF
MSDLAPHERLLPFLLDRLTDEDPANSQESRDKRAITFRQFQRAILRDLAWLLNSPNKPNSDNIHEFPLVKQSVLNYGVPDITGFTLSNIAPAIIERMIRDAILAYEPRILRETLEVSVVTNAQTPGNNLSVEIRGQVFAQPLPENLFVKTNVDLESGLFNLQDQING